MSKINTDRIGTRDGTLDIDVKSIMVRSDAMENLGDYEQGIELAHAHEFIVKGDSWYTAKTGQAPYVLTGVWEYDKERLEIYGAWDHSSLKNRDKEGSHSAGAITYDHGSDFPDNSLGKELQRIKNNSSDYQIVDSFEQGATITERNQVLRVEADGRLYRWAGDLPKVVVVGSTPEVTGDVQNGAWIEVSNTTLRQELMAVRLGLKTIKGLTDQYLDKSKTYVVYGYHSENDMPETVFRWDPIRSVKDHNGGTVIDPTKYFPLDWTLETQQVWYTARTTDEVGVWVSSSLNVTDFACFGAKGQGTDDSLSIQAALISTKNLSCVAGSTYLVNDLVITDGKSITGPLTFKKFDVSKKLLTISAGKANSVTFNEVCFDGAYLDTKGEVDVYITSGNIFLNNCQHNNISNRGVATGYSPKAIPKIVSKNCSSNGNNASRKFSEPSGVYDFNYVTLAVIEDYHEEGTGIFEPNTAGTGYASIPMLSIFSTYTRLVITRPNLKGCGGIVLYTGCDNSTVVDPLFDNCYYGVSAQELNNFKLVGGVFQNFPEFATAVRHQPYARLVGSNGRKEIVNGFSIKGTRFYNNYRDVAVGGYFRQGGQNIIPDARAKNIIIENAVFDSTLLSPLTAQDSGVTVKNCSFVLSGSTKRIYAWSQTAQGGSLGIRFENCYFDGSKQLPQIPDFRFVYFDGTTPSTLNDMHFAVEGSTFLNIKNGTLPMFQLSGYGSVKVNNNNFSGEVPDLFIRVMRSNLCEVMRNTGLAYPLEQTSALLYEDNLSVSTDVYAVGRPSLYWSDRATPIEKVSVGSIVMRSAPDSTGYLGTTLTDNGWKKIWKVES